MNRDIYMNGRERLMKPPGLPEPSPLQHSWGSLGNSALNTDTFYSTESSRTWSPGDAHNEIKRNSTSWGTAWSPINYYSTNTENYYGHSSNSWTPMDTRRIGTPFKSALQDIWKDSGKSNTNPLSLSYNQPLFNSSNKTHMNYTHCSSSYVNQGTNLLMNASKNGYRPPRMRRRMPSCVECVFCKNNGAPEDIYRGHILKDPEGIILCPKLRAYNCPVCNNGGGDKAHTIRYCPMNRPNGWRRNLDGFEGPAPLKIDIP